MVATEEHEALRSGNGESRDPSSSLSEGEQFDRLLRRVGGSGRWQWYLFFITNACGLFVAWHNLAAGELAYTGSHSLAILKELIVFIISSKMG